MKNPRPMFVLLLSLVLAGCLVVAACAKKGGDDDDNGTGDDTGDCADNAAPELLGVSFLVNGSAAAAPISIAADDLFGIYFSYNDDDCNLPGGRFFSNLDDAGYEAFSELLPAELGCSSAQSGLSWGFSMINPMDAGDHTFAVYWTDACGTPSNEEAGGWTVASK